MEGVRKPLVLTSFTVSICKGYSGSPFFWPCSGGHKLYLLVSIKSPRRSHCTQLTILTEDKVLSYLPDNLNPYPNKPRLTFKCDGTFKLTVFSDLHYGENPWDDWGPEQDFNSTRLMRRVLKDEKPDYVYAIPPPHSSPCLTIVCV